MSVERLAALERLEACILACEEVLQDKTACDVNLDHVIALARKIAPAMLPPQGLRYAPDQGPLEALPSRFRLPFPSQDEMRQSSIFTEATKSALPSSTPPEPPRKVEEPRAIEEQHIIEDEDEDDDFADDF